MEGSHQLIKAQLESRRNAAQTQGSSRNKKKEQRGARVVHNILSFCIIYNLTFPFHQHKKKQRIKKLRVATAAGPSTGLDCAATTRAAGQNSASKGSSVANKCGFKLFIRFFLISRWTKKAVEQAHTTLQQDVTEAREQHTAAEERHQQEIADLEAAHKQRVSTLEHTMAVLRQEHNAVQVK